MRVVSLWLLEPFSWLFNMFHVLLSLLLIPSSRLICCIQATSDTDHSWGAAHSHTQCDNNICHFGKLFVTSSGVHVAFAEFLELRSGAHLVIALRQECLIFWQSILTQMGQEGIGFSLQHLGNYRPHRAFSHSDCTTIRLDSTWFYCLAKQVHSS